MMSTTQAVSSHQGTIQPLEGLRIQLKAERVQEPLAAEVGDNVTYVYEFSVNQSQPVTIEVPLVAITFHGQSAASGNE
jgi:hypothetical protein